MSGHSIVDTPDRSAAEVVHGMWSAVAPAWAEHSEYADRRGAAVTERVLELTALQPGDRVLELASGPGGLGIAAAERVAPDGLVVLSDVAPEMVAIASQRAKERGLANVEARVLDLERIDEPDASYDVVLCREGLMFAFDPAGSAREITRVLRPGGRAAVAVWGPREENPWLGLVFDAAAAEFDRPVPPPGIPGPFSLSDRDQLAQLLSEAGLADVAVEDVDVPLRAASFDEWWIRTTALAGPLSKMLESLPPESAASLRARVREAVRPYETTGGLDLPGLTLLGSGRRA